MNSGITASSSIIVGDRPNGRIFKSLWNQKLATQNPSVFNRVPWQTFDVLIDSFNTQGKLSWNFNKFFSKLVRKF